MLENYIDYVKPEDVLRIFPEGSFLQSILKEKLSGMTHYLAPYGIACHPVKKEGK